MATTTIEEHADLLTFMVVFTLAPELQDGHIAHLQEVAAEQAKIDGFVSCAIHKSEDGTRVMEYIQWRSRAHFDAMRANLKNRPVNPPYKADPQIYEVVSVITAG